MRGETVDLRLNVRALSEQQIQDKMITLRVFFIYLLQLSNVAHVDLTKCLVLPVLGCRKGVVDLINR